MAPRVSKAVLWFLFIAVNACRYNTTTGHWQGGDQMNHRDAKDTEFSLCSLVLPSFLCLIQSLHMAAAIFAAESSNFPSAGIVNILSRIAISLWPCSLRSATSVRPAVLRFWLFASM